jgi:hypothetical protein
MERKMGWNLCWVLGLALEENTGKEKGPGFLRPSP